MIVIARMDLLRLVLVKAKERLLGREIREWKTKISNLQVELNEDLPVNIQALQDALQVSKRYANAMTVLMLAFRKHWKRKRTSCNNSRR